MTILGIDPGPQKSGWAFLTFNPERVIESGTEENDCVLYRMEFFDVIVIEWMSNQGRKVGGETFETCRWVGRFQEHAEERGKSAFLLTRTKIRSNIAGGPHHANDATVRAAIIERYGGKVGAIGTKADPGPLRNVTGHAWQALAAALCWWDLNRQTELEGVLS